MTWIAYEHFRTNSTSADPISATLALMLLRVRVYLESNNDVIKLQNLFLSMKAYKKFILLEL